MTKKYNVAVVGATGAVGETMIAILEQRQFPVDKFFPLASSRSAGNMISFNGKKHQIQDLAEFDFTQADIGLFSAGGDISAIYAPKAGNAGCVVIDNTAHFRYDDDIPLVIPEVNPQAADDFKPRNIIANPNCSTIQMLVALKPLHDVATIKRINVATYQAVSGSGKAAIEELSQQTTDLLNFKDIKTNVYPKQIAFNVLPHIDVFLENGYTKEEMKMVWETNKILDSKIKVNPSAVRVPVFYSHSEAINIETETKISAEAAREILNKAPGIKVIDQRKNGGYATPVTESAGNDQVFVSRIREDISCPNGLNLWVVSDNVRKGAALNSVQIAELLIERGLV